MSIKPILSGFAAIICIAGAALAQDNQTANESSETLSTGTPVESQQPYLAEEFGDWDIVCLPNPDGDDPCSMYQLLMDGEGNRVAEVRFFPLADGGEAAAGANLTAPHGTLLTAGVRLDIDGNAPKVYPFTVCDQVGCHARMGFTADELAALKNGIVSNVQLVPFGDSATTVNLKISLTGFTAAFENRSAAQ